MMGKDERECVKLPFGEYLKVPDDRINPPVAYPREDFCWVVFVVL